MLLLNLSHFFIVVNFKLKLSTAVLKKNTIIYYMIGFLHSGDIADFDSDDNPKVPCTMHYGLNLVADTL